MVVLFGETEHYPLKKYDSQNDPNAHLIAWHNMWVSGPKDEWVYSFVHTLKKMSQHWCVPVEIQREIMTREYLAIYFSHTLIFVDVDRQIHNPLQHIRDVVLEIVPLTFPKELHEVLMMQSIME